MKYTKEEIQKIRKQSITELDSALDVLASMEKNKSLPNRKGKWKH